MDGMTMISVDTLDVKIGAKPIVSNVSFSAQSGAVTTIIGPNGSGKTTLMKAISGDLAYRGSIQLMGHEVSAMKPWQMSGMRAVLPQSASLSFPFTVNEVVRLGIATGLHKTPPAVIGNRVREALQKVDLNGFAGRTYQELSGGEQQRVQLARVLCQVWEPVVDNRPRFLFLDEPISSLDIRHQLVILDIARDFARAGGGVLSILHDLNLTAMYSDHVVVMHRGQCQGSGTVKSIMNDHLLQSVFECKLRVGAIPDGNQAFILPQTIA